MKRIIAILLINAFLLPNTVGAGETVLSAGPASYLSPLLYSPSQSFQTAFSEFCNRQGKENVFLDDSQNEISERDDIVKSALLPVKAGEAVQKMFDFLAETAQRNTLKDADLAGADVMIVFGHYDLRVAEEAALYERFAKKIITVGNVGTYIKDIFNEPEAVKFKKILVDRGVPEDKIIVETGSRNTMENLDNAFAILKKQGINPKKIILVSAPLQQIRAMATARLYHPDVHYISYAAYTPDMAVMDTDKLVEMLSYGLREMRQITQYDKNNWISLTAGEREKLREVWKLLEASQSGIREFLGFSIEDEQKVRETFRRIIKKNYVPLIEMQEKLEGYKEEVSALIAKRGALIQTGGEPAVIDAYIEQIEKKISDIRKEQIAQRLIEQGAYKKADPALPSKQELVALIDKTMDILRSEETKGLLKKRIDQIAAKEVFRQGHVVFIPELNEKLIVVTDLHGDLISLNNILKETDFEKNMESANPNLRLVFLGDYINSGVNSIGVLERLMELKIKYPKYVTLLRGNNEVPGDKFGKDKDYYKWEKIRLSPDKQQEMIKTMGQVKRHSYFVFELMAKYGNTDSEDIYEKFLTLFEELPGVVVTAEGLVMSHSAPPLDYQVNLLDIADDDNLAYEMRVNSTWTDKDSPNEPILGSYRQNKIRKQGFLDFLKNIGGRIYIGGHVSFNANQIQYDGKMVVLHSQNTKSPDSGYYFYQQNIGAGSYAVLDLNRKYDVFTGNEMRPVPFAEAADSELKTYKKGVSSKNLDVYDGKFLAPNTHESYKFFSDKTAMLFYGLTTIAFVDRKSPAYKKLCELQENLKADLEKAGMGECVSFLEQPSFHMTVTDIDPSRDENDEAYYYKESGISREHLQKRVRQMETAFKRIGTPGRISAQIKKLWFKRAISTLVDFSDSGNLGKVFSLESTIKMSTGTDVRNFSGHVSLGYIVKVPQDHETFLRIFKKYQYIDLGEVNFEKIDFCYFPSMNIYVPLLTKNLVTGETEEHKEAIETVAEYQTKQVFRKANRLIGAIIRQSHRHDSAVVDRITQPGDPLGVSLVSRKAGESSEKYVLTPVAQENPFGTRPRQEIIHVLQGRVRCVFYTENNEYSGEQVALAGDTVLFTEGRQMFFEEDSTLLRIEQGPYPGSEERDKIILPDKTDTFTAGQAEVAGDRTAMILQKDGRLIGVIVKAGHVPGTKPDRFTAMDTPLQFNSFFKGQGSKGTKLYHTPVEGKNPFGDRPRQEVLFILKGKVRVTFSTKENEDVAQETLTAGDAVLFTEGHLVEFLEDTVFLEAKQGPYPSSGNKDDEQVLLPDTEQNLVITNGIILQSQPGYCIDQAI